MLTAWFRVAFAVVFGSALVNLVSVLQLLTVADYATVLETGQLQAQVMLFLNAYDSGFLIGLVFFGVHLLLLGYLIFKSGYMPRILGILMVIAAVGYLIDSFANIVLAAYADYEVLFLVIVAVPAVLAELSLTLWLLIQGVNVEQREMRALEAS